MRVLGFVTGAALVIGAMVMVLGSPELRDEQGLVPVEVTAQRLALPAIAEAVAEPVVEAPLPDAPAEPVGEVAAPAESVLPAELVTEAEVPATRVADVPLPEELQGPEWGLDESLETEPLPPASVEPASPATVLAEVAPLMDEASAAAAPAAPAQDAHWQSIWNPFRSQIAANGFAARLSAVTDIDYRVVCLKPGAYQVAFAYSDDSERAAKLAQIQGATGLDLPEAVP
ncbi:MAG: hypothetical protein JSV45_09790 [Chromatiales bacterium]|nr:MAG: hypothetical protein JSV45_09790 [Chromatiales bacterium]